MSIKIGNFIFDFCEVWGDFGVQIHELKRYITNNDKIEYILNDLGCHSVKFHPSKNYYTSANPDGDNKAAVCVINDQHLSCRNYTRYIGDNADIFTLIQFYKKIDFKEAFRYAHKVLGLKFSVTDSKPVQDKPKQDPLDIFKKVINRKTKINVFEYDVLSENAFNDFVPYIHSSWFKEGVIKRTIDKFGLAYSYKHKRTVVPLRHWATGELLGFNMRTSVDNCTEFGIAKYFTTPNYPKSINLFGLWENSDSIQTKKSVVVFESEKSVLKRHSRNDETGVALSGHALHPEQVRILIGLGVPITIAMDKDVDLQEVRHMCEKFYGIRPVYYIFDRWGLLGAKDSPSDANNQVYEFMFKHRIEYDKKEHLEYLKYKK